MALRDVSTPETGGMSDAAPRYIVEEQGYARAILNILDDFGGEQVRLRETQRAIMNLLEDFAGEKPFLDAAQSAIINILDDAEEEKRRISETQRATLNILEDSADERRQMTNMQRAIFNILDDFGGEQKHLKETQRAIMNILDDFGVEKKKVEHINAELVGEITERKKAEAALRHANTVAEASNRELEAFSYSVSHDLRSPLWSIEGFSQAIVEDYADRLDDRGRDFLRRIHAASRRMATLIEDMLKLSRITRTGMIRADVDLTALVRDIISGLRQEQPDRRVEFVIAPGVHASGDKQLLRIALENLLNNAFKFTGTVDQARIEFGTVEENGERVYFVRDNGVGFNMAYADKLFVAFQRLHNDWEFPGTGIGLATVQRVINKHGGRIWARSEQGKGAAFYFVLPGDKEIQ